MAMTKTQLKKKIDVIFSTLEHTTRGCSEVEKRKLRAQVSAKIQKALGKLGEELKPPITATEQHLRDCLRATQSRRESFIEALVGTAIGFCVALVGQVFIMAYYGIASTLVQDFGITLFFTGISIIRSYAVRRFFEGRRK